MAADRLSFSTFLKENTFFVVIDSPRSYLCFSIHPLQQLFPSEEGKENHALAWCEKGLTAL
jgi:hypothetical protein